MTIVTLEKSGHIARVCLNRPDAMNAISQEMRERLFEIWQDVQSDHDVWVVILTGAGDRAFSTGADLKESAARRHARKKAKSVPTLGHDLAVYKPIICGIHGYCLAGGLEMALSCDIRVAADTAELGMTMTRWGISATTSATLLPRVIGRAHALEMLLTAAPVSARKALDIGLVHKVVPLERLEEACEEYARLIVRNSPMAVQSTKEAVLRGMDLTSADSLALGRELQAGFARSKDAIEGPRAFSEKREPHWSGK